MFQFVPSRGGQRNLSQSISRWCCFNSCPHAEGNATIIAPIAAPGWFQFVPSRGGQHLALLSVPCLKLFQFVPSRGGQPLESNAEFRQALVSIRALTRRATFSARRKRLSPRFQFVPSRGGQHKQVSVLPILDWFQFVPSRGGQHQRESDSNSDTACFNSCPHAEGNKLGNGTIRHWNQFQFVPSRGGQPLLICGFSGNRVFQFVPSRGGQPRPIKNGSLMICFNSCPHAEGNHVTVSRTTKVTGFNSCPHAEGNAEVHAIYHFPQCFNSCPHAEGNQVKLNYLPAL